MDEKTGGQLQNDLQRQTASAIARKKVLAAYAKSARTAELEKQGEAARLKDEPVTPKINSESWKKYHSAWQNYYQKYYSEYYTKAAKDYIAKEKLKAERQKADEEKLLESLTLSSSKLDKKQGSMNIGGAYEIADNEDIKTNLKQKIRRKATENAKKSRKWRKVVPIVAGLAVMFTILFLQYNRLIFAPIMAYVSPGNVPPSEIEAIDPTITQTVSADPRLIIPKLNVDVPIRFGVEISGVMSAMNNGVAHYRIAGASAYPGEIGNFVITGHSAGDIYSSNPYKYIFSGLERLDEGDLIYVNYESVRYTYSVTRKEVVEPSDVAALVIETDKPLLTLVTCTPLGTSRYRLLVISEQISPAPDTAETPVANPEDEDVPDSESLPANEPSFFEGIWNFLTGN